MIKRSVFLPLIALFSALAVLAAGPAQAWEPKKPVDFEIGRASCRERV